MQKELEDEFYSRIDTKANTGKSVRDIINDMIEERKINSAKQAWHTLKKWSGRGIYNYGVCLDLGWIEKNHD